MLFFILYRSRIRDILLKTESLSLVNHVASMLYSSRWCRSWSRKLRELTSSLSSRPSNPQGKRWQDCGRYQCEWGCRAAADAASQFERRCAHQEKQRGNVWILRNRPCRPFDRHRNICGAEWAAPARFLLWRYIRFELVLQRKWFIGVPPARSNLWPLHEWHRW